MVARRCGVAPVLAGIGLVAVMTAPVCWGEAHRPDRPRQPGGDPDRRRGGERSRRLGRRPRRRVNGDRRMDVIIGAPSAGTTERLLRLGVRRVRPAIHGDDRPREPRRRRFRIDGAAQGDVPGSRSPRRATSTATASPTWSWEHRRPTTTSGSNRAPPTSSSGSGRQPRSTSRRSAARFPDRRRVELRVRRLVGRGRRRRQRRQEARRARGSAVRRQRRARHRAGGIRAEPGRFALRRLRPGRGHERRSRRPR